MYDASTLSRFWQKVARSGIDDCWLWQASLNQRGYGQFRLGQTNGSYLDRAHRVSYRIHYGDIPNGLQVLHTCDVRRCVNPNHLWLGSNEDNRQDMMNKGRYISGVAKITAAQAQDIRRLAKKGLSSQDIAKLFPIGLFQVYAILRGDHWS